MASTRQLTRLFDALRAGDLDRARRAADDIAADAERRGHASSARALRTALRADGHVLHAPVPPAAVPEALGRVSLDKHLDDLELPPELREELETVATEVRFGAELADLGLPRRTKLLFSGPPGCGKSASARALGLSLGLPVYVVRIDGILGSLLGQTSGRIHEVFRFAERTPCVLLIDELDALGRRRGERHDVAELDRVVVGLMQELDYTQLPGLLVATTNFVGAVDEALARRFDLHVAFPSPDIAALRRFLRARAEAIGSHHATDELAHELAPGTSYADAERALIDRARAEVLERLVQPGLSAQRRRR